jgi:hypothetical protein
VKNGDEGVLVDWLAQEAAECRAEQEADAPADSNDRKPERVRLGGLGFSQTYGVCSKTP